MPKRKAGYEELLEDVIETLKRSPEELSNVLESSGKVLDAAKDMTRDEWALIKAYVESDLKEFSESYEESKSGPFYLTIAGSIWQGLLDITDKTRLEWTVLFSDIERQGVYQTGDVIGLGTLVCEKCGHKIIYNHPTTVTPCIECGHNVFTRQSLNP